VLEHQHRDRNRVCVLGTTGLVGCEQKPSAMDATKEAPAGETKSEPTAGQAK
jgi:hypothetical protein